MGFGVSRLGARALPLGSFKGSLRVTFKALRLPLRVPLRDP